MLWGKHDNSSAPVELEAEFVNMHGTELTHSQSPQVEIIHAVNLKLAALGCVPVESHSESDFQDVARAILNHRSVAPEQSRLAPCDQRERPE